MKSNQEKREEIRVLLSIDNGWTLENIAINFGMKYSLLTKSTSRTQERMCLQRNLSMAYFYGQGYTLAEIAKMHNRKNHTTILNAVKTIKNLHSIRDKIYLDIWSDLKYGIKKDFIFKEDWDVLDFLP